MAKNFSDGPRRKEELRIEQKQQISARMYVVMLMLIIGFGAVAVRLFLIQIRDSQQAYDKGANQYESPVISKPRRGLIYDRNRSILVSNTYDLEIAADPKTLQKRDSFAIALSRIFEKDKSYYLEHLLDKSRQYVVLEKAVPLEMEQRLTERPTPGVIVVRVPRRKINFHSLASQVIGYTNNVNRGMSGIELEFNEELAGKEGYVIYQRDGKGRIRPDIDNPRQDVVNGKSIVLTLDQTYQAIAEEEIVKGARKSGAKAAVAIILQPRTGEVLAMANYPAFSLDDRTSYDSTAERNRVIMDLFNPGSTFKIVTACAALNEGIIDLDEKINAEKGSYTWAEGERPIRDTHAYGQLTFKEAIEHSSNICMVKIARRLGQEKLFTYIRKFGFGVPTGVELPSERTGSLEKPSEWKSYQPIYLSFGYEILVNALQIASAYSSIANDGVLMQPFIKRWMLDEDGTIIEEGVPRMIRRVVSKETAAKMKECLEGVVSRGTARLARIEGMRIAGKTGTAQKIINRSYSKSSYLSSFVGFFPVEDPKILIFVLLDSPDRSRGYTGGSVAAPVFREIAVRLMNVADEFSKKPGFLPVRNGDGKWVEVPNLGGMRVDFAKNLLRSRGLEWSASGSGEIVSWQDPAGDSVVSSGTTVRVRITPLAGATQETMVTIPDLCGLTMRQAVTLLKAVNLKVRPSGSGIVTRQFPQAGEKLPPGSECLLFCESRKISTANVY